MQAHLLHAFPSETSSLPELWAELRGHSEANLSQQHSVNLRGISEGLISGGADWCYSRFNVKLPLSIDDSFTELKQIFQGMRARTRDLEPTTVIYR